jgi:hypothetical protein
MRALWRIAHSQKITQTEAQEIFSTAYHSSDSILDIALRLLMLPFVMTCISAALRPALAPIRYLSFVSRLPLCVLSEPTKDRDPTVASLTSTFLFPLTI